MQEFSNETQRRAADSYRFGGFELNPSQRTLYREGESILLQPKAFDTLLLLVANARRLVRKDELQDAIWPDVFVSDANLTNIVVTLRKILGREAIETVPKYGYRFKAPIDGEPGVAGDVFALLVRAKDLMRARSIEATVEARGLLWLASLSGQMGFDYSTPQVISPLVDRGQTQPHLTPRTLVTAI